MCAFTMRPPVMGRRGVVTSGHYLATAAGFRVMEQGGNAIDAAAAMSFCLNLVEPHQNGLGGEVPTLIYSANEGKVYAMSGVGWTPAAFTIAWCREHGIDMVPGDGYLPATVPAPVGTWALALARFGTMTFGQVMQPAIELAEQGYPVYEGLHAFLAANLARFTDAYPTTGAIYCPGGRVPEEGELLRNPDFARTLRLLCQAEAEAGGSRIHGIEAAGDAFYRGPVAEQVVRFIADNPVMDASGKEHAGLLSYEDMADWQATAEEPLAVDYRGLLVHKCPAWTQGPVFLQQLTILEGLNLRAMGHNTA
jgi:gamma-glutamyltranspeptidase / glutathione hydrolase